MLTALRRLGFRRGVLGGSQSFLAVWLVLTGLRLLKRLAAKEPEVVFREELRPGTALLLTHEAPR